MSILIRGMKMPKECRECPFVEYSSLLGNTWCKATAMIMAQNFKPIEFDGRHESCPLVEIPPHGRLIDADELHSLFENQWHYLQCLNWDENPKAEAIQTGINWCINTLHDDAPIVIEAEEEQEE